MTFLLLYCIEWLNGLTDRLYDDPSGVEPEIELLQYEVSIVNP
jgi:hypothetical protein